MKDSPAGCESGWEALRGDVLPWLLDSGQPNLHWRVLVELVRRPESSPAVRRTRGGANAAEPVASLLRDLLPDGTWSTGASPWTPFAGAAWRLIAAAQWGADPLDPRLQEAARRLLDGAACDGGFARNSTCGPESWLTARTLQALAGLGWSRHPRFLEGLAWLEETRVSWGTSLSERAETAASVLGTLTAGALVNRRAIRNRAVEELNRVLAAGGGSSRLGHPNLHRTDLAEMLWSLAMAGVPAEPAIARAARRLQRLQHDGARWVRTAGLPRSLPVPDEHHPRRGEPSRWITLHAAVAVMHYAVSAKLPRMFPAKPA